MSAISMRKALAACMKAGDGEKENEVEEVEEEEDLVDEEDEDLIEDEDEVDAGVSPTVHNVEDSDDSLAGMITNEEALAQDEQLSDDSEDEGEIFPCTKCSTVFMTAEYLNSHKASCQESSDPLKAVGGSSEESKRKHDTENGSSPKRKRRRSSKEDGDSSPEKDLVGLSVPEIVKDLEQCLNEDDDELAAVEGDVGSNDGDKDDVLNDEEHDSSGEESSGDEGEVFPCNLCQAVFMTSAFLEVHFDKAHKGTTRGGKLSKAQDNFLGGSFNRLNGHSRRT